MRKVSLIAGFLLLSVFVCSSAAVEVTLFGPVTYERTKGEPNTYTDSFSIEGLSGHGKLIIQNGNNNKKTRVSSTKITFNGE